METLLVVVAVMFFPFAALVALLGLATRIERARAAVISRQIALTEAIHRDLGPSCRRGSRGAAAAGA